MPDAYLHTLPISPTSQMSHLHGINAYMFYYIWISPICFTAYPLPHALLSHPALWSTTTLFRIFPPVLYSCTSPYAPLPLSSSHIWSTNPHPSHMPYYPSLPYVFLPLQLSICPTTPPFRMSYYLCNFPYALLPHPSITSHHIHILLHMSYYHYSLIWPTITNLPYLEGDLDINTRYNYLRKFGIICTITVLHKLI